MKKTLLILTLVILFQWTGSAQKIYIQASGGYALGFLKDNISDVSLTTKVANDTLYDELYQNESHLFSFGTGGRLTLAVGMKINDYISVEVAGFYNPCKSLKTESSEYYTFPEEGFFFDYNEHYTYKGNEFGFIPAMKLSYPKGSIKPYTRLGIIFSFINLTTNYQGNYFTTHPMYYPTGNEHYTLVSQRNLSIGVSATLGFDLILSDRLIFFFEANGSFISYKPKKAEYTEYQLNGDDILDDLTVYERQVEYVKSFTSTDVIDEDSPRKELINSLPFSSIGLSAGIRFNLFK